MGLRWIRKKLSSLRRHFRRQEKEDFADFDGNQHLMYEFPLVSSLCGTSCFQLLSCRESTLCSVVSGSHLYHNSSADLTFFALLLVCSTPLREHRPATYHLCINATSASMNSLPLTLQNSGKNITASSSIF
ncbi:hypothetical protein HNY73_017382 [Argiope bruennichi]|uniref:Uncharacterized protein n=1 Tax=Argiope bruennichi TaxID=94029 RepID=A0A8T0EQF0_ARGBR|nr:hypothetical protein HNY73_017382 [Argiope bruennichi]